MDNDEQIQEVTSRVIKGWRSRKKMSQAKLAEELGMHQTAIAKIESGERRVDFATVVRISKILGIPWEEFDINTPTELEVLIRHFSKFVIVAEKWITSMREIEGAFLEQLPVLDDLVTFVGPARVPLSEQVTAQGLSDAMKSLNQVAEGMAEMTPLDPERRVNDLAEKLDNVRNFITKLETARDHASS